VVLTPAATWPALLCPKTHCRRVRPSAHAPDAAFHARRLCTLHYITLHYITLFQQRGKKPWLPKGVTPLTVKARGESGCGQVGH
jgi:hypothetical protein